MNECLYERTTSINLKNLEGMAFSSVFNKTQNKTKQKNPTKIHFDGTPLHD